MARLSGKVAIVTGAGGGIGREHALLFAREGASVVVNDIGLRTGADAGSVVKEIVGAGGTAIANTSSATWGGADEIVAAALEAFGRVDILVNNATAVRDRCIDAGVLQGHRALDAGHDIDDGARARRGASARI
jgi:NAD(P)-dependent dehydrogenase (short-subunit alcohol dehydrogenase family)